MCCSNGLAAGQLIFTQKQADALVANARSFQGKHTGKLKSAAELLLVATASPNGNPVMLTLAAETDSAGFYTEAGSYQIGGEFQKSGFQLDVRVGVFKNGAVARELSWSLDLPRPASISKVGLVTNVKVIEHEGIGTQGCFEDCIRRHAGQCVAVCDLFGWGSNACWACAAAAAGCCAINCHC